MNHAKFVTIICAGSLALHILLIAGCGDLGARHDSSTPPGLEVGMEVRSQYNDIFVIKELHGRYALVGNPGGGTHEYWVNLENGHWWHDNEEEGKADEE